jgi:hypothetical protein
MTNRKTVSIHQPNFFPWIGYFDKIVRSDVFILLDDVQFPKTGGGWSNRVKLLVGSEVSWVTAAIDRAFSGTRNINEMNFLGNNPWREKIKKMLEYNYKKHPFYDETINWVEPLLLNKEANIAAYNIQLIITIVKLLGLGEDKLKVASVLAAEGQSNERLCSLTQLVGGQVYMCGGGADGYQDEAEFTERGIQLLYQSFKHPVYPQKGQKEFVPGLSIVDAFMNIGAKGVAELLMPKI